jgi:hypothetical protein
MSLTKILAKWAAKDRAKQLRSDWVGRKVTLTK